MQSGIQKAEKKDIGGNKSLPPEFIGTDTGGKAKVVRTVYISPISVAEA